MARRRMRNIIFLLALFIITILLFQCGKQQSTPNIRKGIDVSEWQNELDFKKLKKHDDIQFAILRCSFGIEGTADKMFETHYKNASAANLDIGVYHYSHATTVDEALQEAATTLKMVEGKSLTLPIFYDIETDRQDHLTKTELTDIIIAYLEAIKEKGYQVGIYANLHWVNTRLEMERLSDYPLWVANYNEKLHYEGDYSFWQYTQHGTLKDYPGNFDFNYQYK